MSVEAAWAFLVDWYDDNGWPAEYGIGSYGEVSYGVVAEDVDVSHLVRVEPAPSSIAGVDIIRPLEQIMSGSQSFEIDNTDGEFSPGNTLSPVYGLVRPGHRMRTLALYGGVTYPVADGILTNPVQHPEVDAQSVSLKGLGPITLLRGLPTQAGNTAPPGITTALYTSILTGAAIGHVLDAVGWPSDRRTLDVGRTTLAYWWLDGKDPLVAIQELLNSEGPGSRFYESGDGNLVFEDRYYRQLTTRSLVSQGAFSAFREPAIAPPLKYDQGYDYIVNAVSCEINVRSAKTLAAVWTNGATITIPPSGSIIRHATSNDPFTAAVAPVSGTDFTVSAGSITSVTLDHTSGSTVAITMTAGVNGATVTGLQLRAQAVTIDYTQIVKNTLDTSTSQDRYGVRSYPYQVIKDIAFTSMQDLVNITAAWWQEPRPQIKAMTILANVSNERMLQALARRTSDRFTVADNGLQIDQDFYVESKRLQIGAGGYEVIATIAGEDADSIPNYFILDTPSLLDGTDVLAA